MNRDYSDILNLPHPVSRKHPQMSLYDRAAQFSPFSALTGYDLAIKETERITEKRAVLDENRKKELDDKLGVLIKEGLRRRVRISYFIPDDKKEGGSYSEKEACISRVDVYKRELLLDNGQSIKLDDIIDLATVDSDIIR